MSRVTRAALRPKELASRTSPDLRVARGPRPLQLDQPWARDAFSVTAARIRAFNASSSIFSPLWKSMARLVLPSRLELKRPDGSPKCGPLRKGHLHDVLVRLAGADQSVVRPHRNPSPLPLLDHLGVGLLDQCAELGEHLAPPVAQLLDPLVYHPRWRLSCFSFLRAAFPLLHVCCCFLYGCFRSARSLEYR